MKNFHGKDVICERLKRQGLLNPLDDIQDQDAYFKLFERLQPVVPMHHVRPGDPPKLVHRTSYNDSQLSDRLRKKHKIVKGRFLGGRVGYVTQEDLLLYATVFKKPLTKVKPIHEEILEAIHNAGGISKDQLKEELPFPAGTISKELPRLQEAFLVYEEQVDTDWDTGWFDFETEWFKVNPDETQYEQAVSTVLVRFLEAFVFGTFEQMKSWSQLNQRTLKKIIQQLAERQLVEEVGVSGFGTGYMKKEVAEQLEPGDVPKGVFMLDRSDFIVRACMKELQEKYKGLEVLQYLLIDGEFQGVVLGHWRIGPYDIDDIQVDLDQDEAIKRKEEVMAAVRKGYPETTQILHYNGEPEMQESH